VARRPLARPAGKIGAPRFADIVAAADLNLGPWSEFVKERAVALSQFGQLYT
jgi:hypothetical protein